MPRSGLAGCKVWGAASSAAVVPGARARRLCRPRLISPPACEPARRARRPGQGRPRPPQRPARRARPPVRTCRGVATTSTCTPSETCSSLPVVAGWVSACRSAPMFRAARFSVGGDGFEVPKRDAGEVRAIARRTILTILLKSSFRSHWACSVLLAVTKPGRRSTRSIRPEARSVYAFRGIRPSVHAARRRAAQDASRARKLQ